MRILITGSRHHTNYQLIRNAIAEAIGTRDPSTVTIVHGAAPGADKLAALAAQRLGAQVESHPADWGTGRAAGPTRNRHMVSLGADLCLAFPLDGQLNKGTMGCVGLARAVGIEVIVLTV